MILNINTTNTTKEQKLRILESIQKHFHISAKRAGVSLDGPLFIMDVHPNDEDSIASLETLNVPVAVIHHGVDKVFNADSHPFTMYTDMEANVHHPNEDYRIALKELKSTSQQHARFHRKMLYKLTDEQFETLKAFDIQYVGTEKNQYYYGTADQIRLEAQLLERIKNDGCFHEVDVQDIEDLSGHLSNEQRHALDHINNGHWVSVVEGMAGTGKSTMMNVANQVWVKNGYTVLGCALSGKAAAGLQEGANITSSTVHSLLYKLEKQSVRLSPHHVVVIDEAGMLPSHLTASLLKYADEAGAKVVMLGDDRQLQPIESGGPFKLVKDHLGSARLTTIFRQHDEWARDAVHAFADGRAMDGLRAYQERGLLHFCEDRQSTVKALVEQWNTHRDTDCRQDFILAGKNEEVAMLNQLARQKRIEQGEMDEGVMVHTHSGVKSFSVGERIVFLENDNNANVLNGQLGTLDGYDVDGTLSICKDDGTTVQINPHEYDKFDYGYAMTVHKSQGVTVNRTGVYVSTNMNREMVYVAFSRHRQHTTIYVNKEEFPDLYSVARSMNRIGTKGTTVDVTLEVHDRDWWIEQLSGPTVMDVLKQKSVIAKLLQEPHNRSILADTTLWDTVHRNHETAGTLEQYANCLHLMTPHDYAYEPQQPTLCTDVLCL